MKRVGGPRLGAVFHDACGDRYSPPNAILPVALLGMASAAVI